MQSVYKNQYVEILIDPGRALVVDNWNESSSRMMADEFQEFCSLWTHIVQKYELQCALTDSREMRFIITPDLQDFANSQMQKAIASGFRKHALLVPQNDLFAEVSLDQFVEEVEKTAGEVVSKVFDSQEKAMQWLIS
jgi:restriction endonuclease